MVVGSLLSILFLSQFVRECVAQQAFAWKFGNNYIQQEFQECQTLPINVIPQNSSFTTTGVPPWYLIAFELGGVPTTTMVGSDPNNLSWQVTHARGATLMLTMVDSNKSTGGIPPNLFNVTAGSSTSCLPQPPPDITDFAIHPNVTDALTTCDPWGLNVTGGQKPYTIVLSALNSPVITNATMGPDDDVLTFIDRADPNGELMASVVDATGRWGASTSTVRTQGSSIVDCIGLVTSSKTSQEIQAEAVARAAAAEAARKRHKTQVVIGAVLGVTLPLLCIGVAYLVWRWRKKRQEDINRGIWDGQDTTIRAWELPARPAHPDDDMRQMGALPTPWTPTENKSSYTTNTSWGSQSGITAPLLPGNYGTHQSSDSSGSVADGRIGLSLSQSSTGPSGSSGFSGPQHLSQPSTTQDGMLSARQRKMLEARTGSSLSSPARSGVNLPALPPGAQPPIPQGAQAYAAALDPDVRPDIIIQHRDGGIVHELPPPYVDRGGGSSGAPAAGSDPASASEPTTRS